MGARLRIAREKLGLHTTKEGADHLGIAASTLGAYEREENSPSADMLRTIAEGYGVTSDWLLGLRAPR